MSSLPHGWQLLRLYQVCDLNPRQKIEHTGDVSFVPMAAVDEQTGVITEPEVKDIGEVRRGFTSFIENDVLFAKITPCMQNGKAAIARDLVNGLGFGSTEFYVLRARKCILPEWLHFFVRRKEFRRTAEASFTGTAGQQRVPKDFLAYSKIPLPPLTEQRRIVEILNETCDIRNLQQRANDLTAKLIPAIFHDMFGDPIGQLPASQRTPVSDFVREMKGGKSLGEDPSGTRNRVIKVSAVTWGKFQPDESKFVSDSYEPPVDHIVKAGDLLFSRANTHELVGATVLVEENFPNVLLSDKIWRFVWKNAGDVDPQYILALFQHPSMRREISINATGTGGSMKNISKGKLMKIRVQLAPSEDQKRFGKIVRDIASMYLDELDARHLMRSLLAHAYSGKLTADWREVNRDLLEREAIERDEWLRETGVKLNVTDTKIGVKTEVNDDRNAELNREQRELVSQIESLELEDSIGTFTLSTLFDELTEPLDKLTLDSVRRHLDVLSVRGLVISVSRQAGAGGSVGVAFGNAFRLPISEELADTHELQSDDARVSELSRIVRAGRDIFASASVQAQATLSATADVGRKRFRAGNLAPKSGLYQELGPDGGIGKTVAMAEGNSFPPPTLDDSVYQWKGEE